MCTGSCRRCSSCLVRLTFRSGSCGCEVGKHPQLQQCNRGRATPMKAQQCLGHRYWSGGHRTKRTTSHWCHSTGLRSKTLCCTHRRSPPRTLQGSRQIALHHQVRRAQPRHWTCQIQRHAVQHVPPDKAGRAMMTCVHAPLLVTKRDGSATRAQTRLCMAAMAAGSSRPTFSRSSRGATLSPGTTSSPAPRARRQTVSDRGEGDSPELATTNTSSPERINQ